MERFDKKAAVINMINRQINPEVACSDGLLRALATVPRELFVPPQLARIAYSDANLFPAIPSPKLSALLVKLVTEGISRSGSKFAVIECGRGYLLHLLSQMGYAAVGTSASYDEINRAIELAKMLEKQEKSAKLLYNSGSGGDEGYDQLIAGSLVESVIEDAAVSAVDSRHRSPGIISFAQESLFSPDIPGQPFSGIICGMIIDGAGQEQQMDAIFARNLSDGGYGVYIARDGAIGTIKRSKMHGGNLKKEVIASFSLSSPAS